jgi:hypothetical protein
MINTEGKNAKMISIIGKHESSLNSIEDVYDEVVWQDLQNQKDKNLEDKVGFSNDALKFSTG